MSIIKSSVEFEGSNITQQTNVIFKPGVRFVNFKDPKNSQGSWFYFLEAYRTDSRGNGVWFNVIKIRDNFGMGFKESFPAKDSDPISYFEAQVKIHYPSYAQVEEVSQNGKKIKQYPTYGRIANKVLFNVAYVNDLAAGAHVLMVPTHQTGDKIAEWSRNRKPNGQLNDRINDYTAAIPVHIQLKKDVSGNPWAVTIDPTSKQALPEQLADSEYLFNLDEVLEYPSHEVLIEKLRKVTPNEIFDTCMRGWYNNHHQFNGADFHSKVVEIPSTITKPVAPAAAVTSINIAKPAMTAPTTSVAPVVDIPKPEAVPTTAAPSPTNPSKGKLDIKAAEAFLKTPKIG